MKCCVKYSNMSRMVKKQLPVVDGMSFTTEGDNFIVSNSNGYFKSLEDEDKGALAAIYVLVRNAMDDLKNGYTANLKMIGVGFKASVNGKFLRTYVGLSHDVIFAIPEGLAVTVANDTEITIKGHNRSEVMQFARAVRDIKKPEPYKGKGIFLNNETILRKEGKKK